MSKCINNASRENNLTVAQIAITHPGALAIFTKYNIDYCCGGHRSLEDACRRVGLDAEKIRIEISKTASSDFGQALTAENWTSTFLADFIVQNHHTFIRKATPELEALLEKVCERHGDENVELLQIREYFQELGEELRMHMEKEEFVLFPAIKRLEAQQGQSHPMEKMIQTPIEALEDEHQIAGDLLKHIRILSNNYTPTDYACPTFRITFQKLKEFDNDLMRHIHLENNILFERFKNLAPMASCNL